MDENKKREPQLLNVPLGAQDLCPTQLETPLFGSRPARPAIHMATVYHCDSPEEADHRLGGCLPGYVYQRDGHPNADLLAEKCRRLHRADQAVVTSSGMSATALAMLSQLQSGDHVLLSHRLYGRTTQLVQTELARLGIRCSTTDMGDLEATRAAMQPATRMLVVETISNPMLHVADLPRLAEIAHQHSAILVVDNTFASPIVCRPLEHGADLVVESLTKIINGHGDVTMGLLCGASRRWERVPSALASWGMTTNPMACWLAERGMTTLHLRVTAASGNAWELARRLKSSSLVQSVFYPGLDGTDLPTGLLTDGNGHPLGGNMLTFKLAKGHTATQFMNRCRQIPFCPSLGDMNTMLSHPATTSHRSLSPAQREALGICERTIRLSIGIESVDYLWSSLETALTAADSVHP